MFYEIKRNTRFGYYQIVVYILAGAVVMAEVKVVVDCVWRGGLYIRSGYSLDERTIVVIK